MESEIGALSFHWPSGLCVQGAGLVARGWGWAAWVVVTSAGLHLLQQPLPIACLVGKVFVLKALDRDRAGESD